MPSDAAPAIRRLSPDPVGPTTVVDEYGVDRPRPADRPWVTVCMVASLDGSIALDGASGGLGNANDRAVLATMRTVVDVVIVGAATAAGEGYGPPKRPDLRIGVVTNSGRIDATSPLFTSGAGFVITNEHAEIPSGVDTLRTGDREVDLAAAVERLPHLIPGVTHVQAEGGPTLNGALAAADLVDEICLTVSPHVVGGDAARLTSGAPERGLGYEPAHVLLDDEGYLFTRWVRRRD
ncbi:MAG: dihydrofolate reductase family protein [Ilumatobacter fluminis]|uniref:dihydrofolate reductase family protein n=1 Tax=Ilumatobacter fluminis TaxID=467091 RepID=UPI0032EEBBCB